MPDVDTGPIHPLDEWKRQLNTMDSFRPQILLCGAKMWAGSNGVDQRKHYERADWATTDIMEGEGVDIVGDLCELWLQTKVQFDGIYCPAVLEHVQRPWVAIHSMSQLLRPNGVVYIETHQTFPLHGYPNDFFRFSVQALETMCNDSGLVTEASGYSNPCTITPVTKCPIWNPISKAFLNVAICARKP